jgi:hypothetical protein
MVAAIRGLKWRRGVLVATKTMRHKFFPCVGCLAICIINLGKRGYNTCGLLFLCVWCYSSTRVAICRVKTQDFRSGDGNVCALFHSWRYYLRWWLECWYCHFLHHNMCLFFLSFSIFLLVVCIFDILLYLVGANIDCSWYLHAIIIFPLSSKATPLGFILVWANRLNNVLDKGRQRINNNE